MEESSSDSEWICTEAWVDQKAAVHRRWNRRLRKQLARAAKAVAPSPPWECRRAAQSRPEEAQELAPGGAKEWGRGGVSVLRCPQPDVLDMQLLPSAGELDLDGISGDGEGEQGRLRPEARLRGVQMCSRGVDVLKGCRCAQGV